MENATKKASEGGPKPAEKIRVKKKTNTKPKKGRVEKGKLKKRKLKK